MSEYTYEKLSQDEFIIYAPDGRVVGKEVFATLAKDKVEILNQETSPLHAKIAALEARNTALVAKAEHVKDTIQAAASFLQAAESDKGFVYSKPFIQSEVSTARIFLENAIKGICQALQDSPASDGVAPKASESEGE